MELTCAHFVSQFGAENYIRSLKFEARLAINLALNW